MRRPARWLSTLTLLAAACGDSTTSPGSTADDSGSPQEDSGSDTRDAAGDPLDSGKQPIDSGIDASMDAGAEDAGPDASSDEAFGLSARPVNATCIAPDVGGSMPSTLSATGCFRADDPSQPLSMLIPFELNAALWSDDASKRRWFALPEGGKIALGEGGDFLFPPGTMLVKEFSMGERRLETRFMVHHPAPDAPDGGLVPAPAWAGYTYQWNEEQTDATLVPDGATTPFDIDGASGASDETWQVPNRVECMTCHTQVANISLGPEIGQLNRDFTYPATGRTANQLLTLDHIDVLEEPLADPSTLLYFPPYASGEATLEEKARSYLHVNCSMCHRKPGMGGTGGSAPDDFRATISFAEMGICNVAASNIALTTPLPGIDPAKAKILVPGDPDNSVLWRRMSFRPDPGNASLYNFQMPKIGTRKVDELGKGLLESWIKTLSECPQ
jgi:uncharacterized repeat protein (TIGR03806 family)